MATRVRGKNICVESYWILTAGIRALAGRTLEERLSLLRDSSGGGSAAAREERRNSYQTLR